MEKLKHLDASHHLEAIDGAPHVLCIFERDDHMRKGQSRCLFRNGYFTYSQVIKYVYALFALLGLFFALLPILCPRQQMATSPLPIEVVAFPSISISNSSTVPLTNDGAKNPGGKVTKSPRQPLRPTATPVTSSAAQEPRHP